MFCVDVTFRRITFSGIEGCKVPGSKNEYSSISSASHPMESNTSSGVVR